MASTSKVMESSQKYIAPEFGEFESFVDIDNHYKWCFEVCDFDGIVDICFFTVKIDTGKRLNCGSVLDIQEDMNDYGSVFLKVITEKKNKYHEIHASTDHYDISLMKASANKRVNSCHGLNWISQENGTFDISHNEIIGGFSKAKLLVKDKSIFFSNKTVQQKKRSLIQHKAMETDLSTKRQCPTKVQIEVQTDAIDISQPEMPLALAVIDATPIQSKVPTSRALKKGRSKNIEEKKEILIEVVSKKSKGLEKTCNESMLAQTNSRLDAFKKLYPLGIQGEVMIDVTKCDLPPPQYNCRPFNRDYCDALQRSLFKTVGVKLPPADVIPYFEKTKEFVEVHDRKILKEKFDEIRFYVVDGQHTIQAAKNLLSVLDAQNLSAVASLRQQYQRRSARILSHLVTPVECVQISRALNELNDEYKLKSTWPELLHQARRQWEFYGHPERPLGGGRTCEKWKAFKSMLEDVMRRKEPKECYGLLFSSEIVWKKWMRLMKRWVDGSLMNSKGEVKPETKNELKFITPYLLRPIQGLIDVEIDILFDKMLAGLVVFDKKDFTAFPPGVTSLKEHCELTKNRRHMKKAVDEHLREEYGITISQGDAFKRYQIDDAFIDDMCSRCPSWCEEASRRTVKTRELPAIVRASLKVKYDFIEHNVASSCLDPWVICYTGPVFQSFEDAHIGDVKKKISLAVVDATHDTGFCWTQNCFLKFFRAVVDSTNMTKFSIVVFVRETQGFSACLQALNQLSVNIRILIGTYTYLKHRPGDILQTSQDFIIAGLVNMDSEDAFPVEELRNKGFDLCFKETVDSKFSAQIGSLDDEESAKNLEKMLKHRFLIEIPKLESVGMRGGALYETVKSSIVYEKLVTCLTSDSDIVVDAYTGGGLGRASITKRRHVISLVDSYNHIEFLRSFYSEVKNNSRVVQTWCVTLPSVGQSPADMIPNLGTLLSSVSQPKDPFAMDSDNEENNTDTHNIDVDKEPAETRLVGEKGLDIEQREHVDIRPMNVEFEPVETEPSKEGQTLECQLQNINEEHSSKYFRVESSINNERKRHMVRDEFSCAHNLRMKHRQCLAIAQNEDSNSSVQNFSTRLLCRVNLSSEPLYVILDLNGVLIKRWSKKSHLPNIEYHEGKWFQLRPGCLEFLRKLILIAKVGIWSTMVFSNVLKTLSYIERKFGGKLSLFMIWSQENCYQSNLLRPDKMNVRADFKPLNKVWKHFRTLHCQNTILIDDSPYKACMNDTGNCVFPPIFDGWNGHSTDDFLIKKLLPLLEAVKMEHDIQSYITLHRVGQAPITEDHALYKYLQPVLKMQQHEILPSHVPINSDPENSVQDKSIFEELSANQLLKLDQFQSTKRQLSRGEVMVLGTIVGDTRHISSYQQITAYIHELLKRLQKERCL